MQIDALSKQTKKVNYINLRSLKLFIFFLFTILIYISNQIYTTSADTIPNSLLPFSLLINHDTLLGRFFEEIDTIPYYLRPFNGDFISSYPIGPALTALPLYALYLLFGGHASPDTGIILAKISASIISALSSVMLYKLLEKLSIKRTYIILFTWLFTFGSQTFSISSQGLWQHGPAELWLILFLWAIVEIYKMQRTTLFPSYFGGIALGMVLLSRPQDIIISFPFIAMLLIMRRFRYIIHAFIAFSPFAIFNYWFNKYFYSAPTLRGGGTEISHILSFPFLDGLLGNLISPSRGLLIFMPWVIFSFFWLTKIFKIKFYKTIYAPTLIAVIMYIVMYSKLGYWTAGPAFGPRYMTDITPLLVLLGAGYLNQTQISKTLIKKLRVALLSIFVIWSTSIHLLGTYVPGGMNWNFAALPDNFTEPLWSLHHSEIPYYFNNLKANISSNPTLVHPQAEYISINVMTKPNIYTQGFTPSVFKPDTVYTGIAKVKNTGNETWPVYSTKDNNEVHLIHKISSIEQRSFTDHTSKRIGKIGSGYLLYPVKPGETITIYFYIVTPKEPGQYIYTFSLSQGSKPFPLGTETQAFNSVLITVQ